VLRAFHLTRPVENWSKSLLAGDRSVRNCSRHYLLTSDDLPGPRAKVQVEDAVENSGLNGYLMFLLIRR